MKSGTETEAGGGREEGGRAVDAKRKIRTPLRDVGNNVCMHVFMYLCNGAT